VTSVEFGVMFMLGLVSSLHCVQMCGPIVLSYSVALESLTDRSPAGRPLLMNHLAYNAGRILTYSVLGAIAGLAGQTMGVLGRVAGFAHILAIVSGVLMILVGISLFGVIPSGVVGLSLFRIPSAFFRQVAKFLSLPGAANRFLLGLALGFLPCGLIYAALIKAMSAGSPIAGAVTMVAFGSGTAGALLALGLFSSAVRVKMNRWGSQMAAAAVTVMGAVLVWRGTMPGMMTMEHHLHAHH
jgi:uncharacterized protein